MRFRVASFDRRVPKFGQEWSTASTSAFAPITRSGSPHKLGLLSHMMQVPLPVGDLSTPTPQPIAVITKIIFPSQPHPYRRIRIILEREAPGSTFCMQLNAREPMKCFEKQECAKPDDIFRRRGVAEPALKVEPPLITARGNCNHRYGLPSSGLMLVSFSARSTLACPLSNYYRVICALYRVIDTGLRCAGLFGCVWMRFLPL